MLNWIYRYPPLETGILLKRYKRFFADIELTSGEVITAHCPNTGPMTGVSSPGSLVKVSHANNPKRKLPYTWEMIQVHDNEPTWVGVNTGLPNRVIKLALEQQLIPEFANRFREICCEVPYGKELKSRVDFLLRSAAIHLETKTEVLSPLDCIERPIYIEVKSATLAQGNIALFPDTSIPYLELSMLDAACFQLFLVNGGGQYSIDAVLANQLNAIATAGVLNSIAQKREQQVESLETSYQAFNSDKEGVSTTK